MQRAKANATSDERISGRDVENPVPAIERLFCADERNIFARLVGDTQIGPFCTICARDCARSNWHCTRTRPG
jgi:hypothetical protein